MEPFLGFLSRSFLRRYRLFPFVSGYLPSFPYLLKYLQKIKTFYKIKRYFAVVIVCFIQNVDKSRSFMNKYLRLWILPRMKRHFPVVTVFLSLLWYFFCHYRLFTVGSVIFWLGSLWMVTRTKAKDSLYNKAFSVFSHREWNKETFLPKIKIKGEISSFFSNKWLKEVILPSLRSFCRYYRHFPVVSVSFLSFSSFE